MTRTIVRIAASCALVALVFYLSTLAVEDCTAGLFVYDNCLWAWVHEQAGLPQSRFLQALTLFAAGLALLVVLYLAVRFIFPRRAGGPSSDSVL
ncbi:MAG: hypothetical protein ACRD1N_02210 [Terriglobia bacterium]